MSLFNLNIAHCDTKYTPEDLGVSAEQWQKRYVDQPLTEGEKMAQTLAECGLGEIWSGPEKVTPPPPAPKDVETGTRYQKLLKNHFFESKEETQLSEDDKRLKYAHMADVIHRAHPDDTCKYLALEEYRCLLNTRDGEQTSKCLSIFDEFRKCQWDTHKINEGITYIESGSLRKAYRFAPNYCYA